MNEFSLKIVCYYLNSLFELFLKIQLKKKLRKSKFKTYKFS